MGMFVSVIVGMVVAAAGVVVIVVVMMVVSRLRGIGLDLVREAFPQDAAHRDP